MKRLLPCLIFLLLPSLLFANGSPINVSEIHNTGNIQMMKKQNILLEEESLFIELDGDYSNVKVEYKLKNQGKADTVKYGFPIDVYPSEHASEMQDKMIENFKIQDDSGFLKTFSYTSQSVDEISKYYSNPDNHGKTVREWFIVDLPFQKHKEKNVTVTYRVKNRLDDWVYTKSFRPEFSDRTFNYIMKPSQNWGNGIVKKLIMKADLRKILKKKAVIKEIHPKGYINKEGLLLWKYSNFNLKTSEGIKIVYDNSADSMTKYIAKERIPPQRISTNVSSILKTDKINRYNYGPENLFDNDLSTAWVEGAKGSGEGEWVEFHFKNAFVSAIGIINGYTKRSSLYYANNRIKKIKIDVESKSGMRRTESTVIELKQKQFNELNDDVRAPFISWLADYGDGYPRITKIRLTILEVYPGSKYNDTCISEFYLLGYAQ